MMFRNVLSMESDQRTEIVPGDERPLLRKWALSPAGVVGLAREADRLERARHPGVVALVDAAEDHLDLEWAGAETLALARLTRGSAARVLTAVATTVADLHDRGIVHGRIEESHVVLGPELQPRLCGLRGPDPGRPEPGPADDVADLGLLLRRAVGMGADQDVVPEHRWRAWPRASSRDRALEAIVERATDPDPARRPTARALARSMADIVPNVPVERHEPTAAPEPSNSPSPSPPPSPRVAPDPADAHDQPHPAVPPRTPPARVAGARLMVGGASSSPSSSAEPTLSSVSLDRTAAGGGRARDPAIRPEPDRVATRPASGSPLLLRAVVGLALLAAAGFALALRQSSSGTPDAATAAGPRSPGLATVVTVDPTAPAASVTPSTTGTIPTYSVHATTVDFGGRTYQVGRAGDRVSVADWDCDGAASAGLVRPSTGEVFLFDGWPVTGAVSISARAQMAGAHHLEGTPPGAGCHPPEVRLDDGTLVPLDTETGR